MNPRLTVKFVIFQSVKWRYDKSPFNNRRNRFDRLPSISQGGSSVASRASSTKSNDSDLRNINGAEEFLTIKPQYYRKDSGKSNLRFYNNDSNLQFTNRAFEEDAEEDVYMEIDSLYQGPERWMYYDQQHTPNEEEELWMWLTRWCCLYIKNMFVSYIIWYFCIFFPIFI